MGVSERKEREKEQRRQAIIDAAEKVFFARGFDNASMNDVAEAAELSKGTLYLYFNSKTDLCMAIIVRSLELIRLNFEKILAGSADGLGRLQQLAESFLQFTIDHPAYYNALLSFRKHSIECSATGDIYRAGLEINAQINEQIEKIIAGGIKDGSISPGVEPARLSQAIWGNLTGILPGCILSAGNMNGREKIEPDAVLRYIFELIQNAIKTR